MNELRQAFTETLIYQIHQQLQNNYNKLNWYRDNDVCYSNINIKDTICTIKVHIDYGR